MDYLLCAIPIGVGATAIIDVWAILRARLFGVPPLDYGLVGRWLAHLARGRFRHESIGRAERVRGERVIGWTAHYLIGVGFALLLLAVWGAPWLRAPTLGPALAVGVGTAAAPFLVLQPAMGVGIAARRTARPRKARVQTLVTHAIFGVGLYVAGWATTLLARA